MIRSRPGFLSFVAGLAWGLASPAPASAQVYVPGGSLHPAALSNAYLDHAALLLTPPRGFDLIAASSPMRQDGRMAAYRDFENALRVRTARLIGGPGSPEERRRAKRQVLADLGDMLDGLPGAKLVRRGQLLWHQIEDTTNFAFAGYRVGLQTDEAVGGKIALEVQKQLR